MIDLDKIFALSPQQARVAQMLARGLSSEQAAERLVVLPDTIRTHCCHIYKRLGVHSRAEMVEWAISAGLLTREESILPAPDLTGSKAKPVRSP